MTDLINPIVEQRQFNFGPPPVAFPGNDGSLATGKKLASHGLACFDAPGDSTGNAPMNSMNTRIIVCLLALCSACAAEEQSPVEKITAEYDHVRSEAIQGINQKYIPLADAEMKLTLKE